MSREPYCILRDIVNLAKKFLGRESLLLERSRDRDSYPYLIPVCHIEDGLAFAACGFLQFHEEYKLKVAELGSPPFPIGLRRAIDATHDQIETRLHGWGWAYVFGPDRMTCLRERLKGHEQTKEYPLLDAALSWRRGKNLARHDTADSLADKAESLEIQPTMTPEEAEKVIWDRHRDWYMSPALAEAIPNVSSEEHGQFANAVDELERLFRRLISPDQLREYAEQNELEARPTPDQLANVDDLHEAKRKGHGLQDALSRAVESWLTVTQAAKVAFTSTGTISRAVDAGNLKSNGKHHRERRIDSADLTRWILARSNRTEPVESNDRVESLMREARPN